MQTFPDAKGSRDAASTSIFKESMTGKERYTFTSGNIHARTGAKPVPGRG